MNRYLTALKNLIASVKTNPRLLSKQLYHHKYIHEGELFSANYNDPNPWSIEIQTTDLDNPLFNYFKENKRGNGIWKWNHYFEIYHKHLAKFVNTSVNLLEIGIYSGGSLKMWHEYLGSHSHIYGIDIEQACQSYENDYTSIFIGDQENRTFWHNFRESVDSIDIIIDDGGHTPAQQKITLEEMLPALNPGAVYICEDIHGKSNAFTNYLFSLINELNQYEQLDMSAPGSKATAFQSCIHSIHFYPFAVVIEKRPKLIKQFSCPKMGDQWQPFTF